MVIDFIIHGNHISGHKFYAPIRIWGPPDLDFDARLDRIVNSSTGVIDWEIEERRKRRLLSLLYTGQGNSDLQFVFY